MSESGVKISDLVAQLKNEANQDREVQFLVVDANTSEVIQMDLRDNIVDVPKLLSSFKKPSAKREGAFDEIREEWPDVPDAIFPKP